MFANVDNVLVLVFDNCSYPVKVTHVRTENRGKFHHVINSYIAVLPHVCNIAARSVWKRINDADFKNWMIASSNISKEFSEQCWAHFRSRPKDVPNQFLFQGTPSRAPKVDMYIQEPMENLQTLQYKDIILVIDEFYRKHIQQTVCNFAFVSGDQQTWIKLMILRQKNQNKYNWIIPIPGEWHWTWHIIKGIFRMFYDSILHPFAKVLGFKSLDKKADNFHYAEDLLEMVTLSVFKWMEKAMENIPTGQFIVEWMHTIKDH